MTKKTSGPAEPRSRPRDRLVARAPAARGGRPAPGGGRGQVASRAAARPTTVHTTSFISALRGSRVPWGFALAQWLWAPSGAPRRGRRTTPRTPTHKPTRASRAGRRSAGRPALDASLPSATLPLRSLHGAWQRISPTPGPVLAPPQRVTRCALTARLFLH